MGRQFCVEPPASAAPGAARLRAGLHGQGSCLTGRNSSGPSAQDLRRGGRSAAALGHDSGRRDCPARRAEPGERHCSLLRLDQVTDAGRYRAPGGDADGPRNPGPSARRGPRAGWHRRPGEADPGRPNLHAAQRKASRPQRPSATAPSGPVVPRGGDRPAAGSRHAAAPAAHRDLAGRESGTLRPARRGPGCPVFSSSPFLRHCALAFRQARQACSRPSALARPVHLPREARARSQSRARTRLGRVGTAGMTGGGRRQHPGLS